jgi:glycosyltransferase involved in cell wall biosynthesis/SAM-dependent methyltransferase
MKPTLHLIGIFHTKHQESFSHCAFTGKALRFPKMMQSYGYKVIEYSNAGSESTADEKVVIMSENEYEFFYGKRKHTDFYGSDAVIGSLGHQCFETKLISLLREKLNPEDIICHPFGHAHERLMIEFPNHQHVETGIGYPTLMSNSFRIFESYAWMHLHQEREKRSGKNYEWVVPNYYDLDDWDPNTKHGNYLAFLGRITPEKGLDTIRAIADYSPYPIILHGQGDPTQWSHPNIEYRGPIHGRERSDFLRNARALLAPTTFIEPFCGMAVESMLCGTPVISVDYGAMTETVQPGMGFRCHTLQDWLDAIDDVDQLDRKFIADTARSKYSLESCGKKYDKIFMQLNNLYRKGWYEVDKINYYQIEQEELPFATRLAKWISNNLGVKNAIDIGCGPGIYVNELRNNSIDAIGYDIDERVKDKLHLVQKSIFDIQEEQTELVLCLEVAEHIESNMNEKIAENITKLLLPGGTLIWSAAHPGQDGVGHINCQPKEYWIDQFEKQGLRRDIETENSLLSYITSGYHMGWFNLNGLVFKKPIEIKNNNDYDFEKDFWGNCANTFHEDIKHYTYAKFMGIERNGHHFIVHGKSILDIGGGPTSMLLKSYDLNRGKVVDPIKYPDWTVERYRGKNIDVSVDCGENVNETGWDEVWIYNCLQHVRDPQKIIENAKRAAPILRIFEWIDIPAHEGHPQELKEELLNLWIGGKGSTATLSEKDTGCHGRVYYGSFKTS